MIDGLKQGIDMWEGSGERYRQYLICVPWTDLLFYGVLDLNSKGRPSAGVFGSVDSYKTMLQEELLAGEVIGGKKL